MGVLVVVLGLLALLLGFGVALVAIFYRRLEPKIRRWQFRNPELLAPSDAATRFSSVVMGIGAFLLIAVGVILLALGLWLRLGSVA